MRTEKDALKLHPNEAETRILINNDSLSLSVLSRPTKASNGWNIGLDLFAFSNEDMINHINHQLVTLTEYCQEQRLTGKFYLKVACKEVYYEALKSYLETDLCLKRTKGKKYGIGDNEDQNSSLPLYFVFAKSLKDVP